MPEDENDKVSFAPSQGELPRATKPLVVLVGVDDLVQGGRAVGPPGVFFS